MNNRERDNNPENNKIDDLAEAGATEVDSMTDQQVIDFLGRLSSRYVQAIPRETLHSCAALVKSIDDGERSIVNLAQASKYVPLQRFSSQLLNNGLEQFDTKKAMIAPDQAAEPVSK